MVVLSLIIGPTESPNLLISKAEIEESTNNQTYRHV